ncbi:MAG: hypothetical protein M0Q43_05245 [Methanothrix sp.]|jgi:hypothetical protein|nr:hypothetical protein [Methanothrix sp.]
MKIEFFLIIVLGMATIVSPAPAQSTEDLNVWNVYCSGDGSRCTVAKEPSGDLMFTVFPGKVDWNTVQTWMQTNGYPAQPAVWNVYCNGDSSQCTVSKEPTGALMFPQFPGKVDWDTAQEWMASWRGENTAGQSTPIGTGTAHTYNGIEFQVEGVALKANAEQTADSIDLEGRKADAVHVLEFAGWSIGVPDNVKVGHINVWYGDGSFETTDLIMGVNIAEWAYDRSEVQSQLKHSKVAPAYSWSSTASSAYEYQGHYFYARVDTDPSKPLDRLELVLDPNEQKIQIEIRAITLEA